MPLNLSELCICYYTNRAVILQHALPQRVRAIRSIIELVVVKLLL